MKRQRGRPKGKQYPEPKTILEAFRIARYRKLGASEGMWVVICCPLLAAHNINQWNREIGTLVRQRICARDQEFFRQIADAIEVRSSRELPNIERRRYLAIQYKLDCAGQGKPFTRRGLRDFYNRHDPGQRIESSTLSKIYKWAKSAEWRGIPITLSPLLKRPENRILKP
jgi:hypothetical protein